MCVGSRHRTCLCRHRGATQQRRGNRPRKIIVWVGFFQQIYRFFVWKALSGFLKTKLLLMEEILLQLIASLSHFYRVLYIPGGAGFLPSAVRIHEIQLPWSLRNGVRTSRVCFVHFCSMHIIDLEPNSSPFLKVDPPKQGRNSKVSWLLGMYIYIYPVSERPLKE